MLSRREFNKRLLSVMPVRVLPRERDHNTDLKQRTAMMICRRLMKILN